MSDTINDPELKAMSRILSVIGRDADRTPETPIGESLRRLAMFRIDMIRQDTNHRDKRRRHQGRASCDVVGRRFEAQGPAPIYKLVTLLWLHGHRGEEFEVWDDVSPFGNALASIPGTMIHANLDLAAPLTTAWELANA